MGPWESLYLWAPLHSVPQMSECIHFMPFMRQVLFWAIFLQKEAYNQEIQTYCNISLQQRIRREVNHFFKNQVMCVLAIHISLLLWRSVFLGLPSILGVFFFSFLLLSCMSCLYILEIPPLSVTLFANIFSHSEGFLFILFMVSQHRELSSVLCDDLKEWDGEMGGRLKRGGYVYTYG